MKAIAKERTSAKPVPTKAQKAQQLPFAIRHFKLVFLGGVILLLFMLFLHIYIGTVSVTPMDVVKVLTGQQVDKLTHTVIWELRLPRALVAILAGAMLALAGAILQSVTRNPLAEPDLTGASAGGVFLAVLYLSKDKVGWDFAPAGIELPFVALAGCILAGGLVYAISWGKRGQGRGHSNPVRLVLTGVLVSTILRSFTSLLLLVNQNASGSILMWIIGSLNGRTWQQWQMLWPWALVTLPIGLLTAGMANTIQLGDDTATNLGMRIEWGRAGMLFAAIFLTAGAVSAVGALGFLGLIAPHLTRRLVGQDARRVYPLSIVMGASLLLLADIVSRAVISTVGLPVGAVMSLIGAPFLIFLVKRGVRSN